MVLLTVTKNFKTMANAQEIIKETISEINEVYNLESFRKACSNHLESNKMVSAFVWNNDIELRDGVYTLFSAKINFLDVTVTNDNVKELFNKVVIDQMVIDALETLVKTSEFRYSLMQKVSDGYGTTLEKAYKVISNPDFRVAIQKMASNL